MKNGLIAGGIILLLLTSGMYMSRTAQIQDPNIISMNGLHTHPLLEIYVKGEKVEIPQNIGVGEMYRGRQGYGLGGMAMTPIHTHDDVPAIHLEYTGKVMKSDTALGNFFSVWGKDMRSFGANMRMTVNGVESTEYESYLMQDGDVIQLHYE